MRQKYIAFLVIFFASLGTSFAHEMLADSPVNARWHIPPKSATATFLGSDQKETAVLVLKKSAVTGTVLTINSDATGVILQSGEAPKITFPIQANADGTTTTLKLEGGDPPTIFLNDKEQTRLSGKAIQIVSANDETLTLSLQNATFATVKFELSNRDSSPSPAPAADGVTPSHTTSVDAATTTDLIQHVKRAVFQIQIFNIQKQLFAGGTGFIISDDGFAITNFHIIQGAAAAQALVNERDAALPLELWSADPEHDLALIRLPKPKEGTKYESLSIADHEPSEGDSVWSVGYTHTGYVVTSGAVSAVKDFQSFPDPLQKSLKSLSPSTRWIQTDCTLARATSGGPLVDAHGQVLGISSWIWLEDKNLNYALAAKHLPSLLRHRNDSALTFAGASEQFLNVRSLWTDLPRESISPELLKPCTPAELSNSADAFAAGVSKPCSRCQGTGKISTQVQTGNRADGKFAVATYTKETHQCDRCRGTGIERASDEALVRMSAVFLKRLSSVVQSDARTQAAVSKCYQIVTDSMIGDYKTWTALTGASRSVFAQRNPIPGTAIIAKVTVTQALPMENGQRRFMVQVAGTDQLVYVVDPVMADALMPGMRITHEHDIVSITDGPRGRTKHVTVAADAHYHTAVALMGGIIDGPGMLTDDKQIVTVVKDGFLIAPPIQEGWWWWWRDRE